jgi:hypothetical protein
LYKAACFYSDHITFHLGEKCLVYSQSLKVFTMQL